MTPPYEILEHTADVGLRVAGRDLAELFAHAGKGMFALMTEIDKQAVARENASLFIRLWAANVQELLFLWLRENLYHFSAHRRVFFDYTFEELTETAVVARASFYLFDPCRHDAKCEIKAVTHHCFSVRKEGNRWLAEIIFDI